MPKDFINEAIKLFPDSDSLYKSIKEAFRTYYGAGAEVIFTDYSEADLLDAIDLNLKSSTRWAVINEKGEYKIEPLDLYPLFKKSLS
jgi:Zn-dependent peptidase ImmA (M78 family)